MDQARGLADLAIETARGGVICGIDEVGRGPLAGPVVAAAVILDRRLPAAMLDGLTDSKLLSAAARERYAATLRATARIGIGAASVAEIDRINILQATFLAMARAVAALGIVPDLALVDGNRAPPLRCPVETLVGGDRISLSIAAASVVAKVTRDRLMRALHARWPDYGWASNAGYPTGAHRAALDRIGPSPHHRSSFGPVRSAIFLRGGLVTEVNRSLVESAA